MKIKDACASARIFFGYPWARRERKRIQKLPLFARYKIDTKVSDEPRDVAILAVAKFGKEQER